MRAFWRKREVFCKIFLSCSPQLSWVRHFFGLKGAWNKKISCPKRAASLMECVTMRIVLCGKRVWIFFWRRSL